MTINISKDAESSINAAVQSGQFASADEMDAIVADAMKRRKEEPWRVIAGE